MSLPSSDVPKLERAANEAEQMAKRSPFKCDRERFEALAAQYRQRARDLRN